MNRHSFDKTQEVRTKVLQGMSLIIALVALVVAYVNIIISKVYILGAIEVLLAVFCFYTYYKTCVSASKVWHRWAVAYAYFFVVFLAVYILKTDEGITHWICTFPILAYLLFGKKHGFISSFCLLFASVIPLYSFLSLGGANSLHLIVNLGLSYMTIWTVSHIYEAMRYSNQETILNLALRDPLTKAFNRRALQSRFSKQTVIDEPVCVALIDIDFFKKVNDKYGHDAGDAVLTQLTDLFVEQFKEDNVFRMGGEEFVVVINADQQAAYDLAKCLIKTVESHKFTYEKNCLKITISIGLEELVTDSYVDLSKILKAADGYLYIAKNNGRNCTVCSINNSILGN